MLRRVNGVTDAADVGAGVSPNSVGAGVSAAASASSIIAGTTSVAKPCRSATRPPPAGSAAQMRSVAADSGAHSERFGSCSVTVVAPSRNASSVSGSRGPVATTTRGQATGTNDGVFVSGRLRVSALSLSLTLSGGDSVAAGEAVPLPLPLAVAVGEKVSVPVGGGSIDSVSVPVSVGTTVADSVGGTLADSVSVGTALSVSVGTSVSEADSVSVRIMDVVTVGFRVTVVSVSVIPSDRVGVGGGVIVGVTDIVTVDVEVTVGGGVIVAVTVAKPVAVSVAGTVTDGEPEGDAVTGAVTEAVAVSSAVCVSFDGDEVASSVPVSVLVHVTLSVAVASGAADAVGVEVAVRLGRVRVGSDSFVRDCDGVKRTVIDGSVSDGVRVDVGGCVRLGGVLEIDSVGDGEPVAERVAAGDTDGDGDSEPDGGGVTDGVADAVALAVGAGVTVAVGVGEVCVGVWFPTARAAGASISSNSSSSARLTSLGRPSSIVTRRPCKKQHTGLEHTSKPSQAVVAVAGVDSELTQWLKYTRAPPLRVSHEGGKLKQRGETYTVRVVDTFPRESRARCPDVAGAGSSAPTQAAAPAAR